MKNFLLTTTLVLISSFAFGTFDHSHSAWTKLLKAHVAMAPSNTSSKVDYKNFNHKNLKAYLSTLTNVTPAQFKTFSHKQKLSFFINAYNAQTIALILTKYPNLKSIKDIKSFSFSNITGSPWKKKFFDLLGKKRSLDEIEHTLVRGTKLGSDARIHFAFNCASIGCPALLNEAFTATQLDSQFDSAAKNFLKDHTRNKVNLTASTVEVSNIFKWYNKDFKTKNYKSLKQFLILYTDALATTPAEKKLLLSGAFMVKYNGYDWGLNKK